MCSQASWNYDMVPYSDANIPAILGFPGIGISRKAFMSTAGFPREQIPRTLMHKLLLLLSKYNIQAILRKSKGANMYHILKTTGASSRASLGLTYGVQDL